MLSLKPSSIGCSLFDAPQASKSQGRSPFFNRGGFCKENLHALPIFSFFVRLEVPFLRPGLQLPERCAQRKASPSCPKGAERVARACAPGPSQAGLAGASTALCSAQGGTFLRCPVPGHGSFRGRHGSPQLGDRGLTPLCPERGYQERCRSGERAVAEPRPGEGQVSAKPWTCCLVRSSCGTRHAAATAPLLKSVSFIHMRCMMTASLRARATFARRMPMRLASASPQLFNCEGRE